MPYVPVSKRSQAHRRQLTLCECGCGEKFSRYDDHGRQRRFISGHNARVLPESHKRILAVLREHGPLTRGELSNKLVVFADELNQQLYRLRERGLVMSPRWGVWAAVDKPVKEPLPRDLVELARVAERWGLGKASNDEFRAAARKAAKR